MSHRCQPRDLTYEATSVTCGVCGRTWEWQRRNGYPRWWITEFGNG